MADPKLEAFKNQQRESVQTLLQKKMAVLRPALTGMARQSQLQSVAEFEATIERSLQDALAGFDATIKKVEEYTAQSYPDELMQPFRESAVSDLTSRAELLRSMINSFSCNVLRE